MVKSGRIVVLECRSVAFFPMFDEVYEELTRPRSTPFEKSHPNIREAAGYAAQEHAFADRFGRGGKVSDVVVGEIGW